MKKINTPMQLKPLYVRDEGNTDEDFYSAMISLVNIAVMHVPQPLVPIIGCLWHDRWVEASKN